MSGNSSRRRSRTAPIVRRRSRASCVVADTSARSCKAAFLDGALTAQVGESVLADLHLVAVLEHRSLDSPPVDVRAVQRAAVLDRVPGAVPPQDEIGRASCRERVQISVVAVSLKKTTIEN